MISLWPERGRHFVLEHNMTIVTSRGNQLSFIAVLWNFGEKLKSGRNTHARAKFGGLVTDARVSTALWLITKISDYSRQRKSRLTIGSKEQGMTVSAIQYTIGNLHFI